MRLKGRFGPHNKRSSIIDLRIRLMLQTRVTYTLFAARQSYQRGILRWS